MLRFHSSLQSRSQRAARLLGFAAIAVLAAGTVSAHAQTVKATISFAQPTAGIAANPFTNRIYVVAPSFGGPTDTLAVIDGKTNTVIDTISIPAGAYLPAVNVLTDRIYVATCATTETTEDCFVSVVNGKTDKYLGKVPITTTVGNGLLGIAVDPIHDRVYVSNASDNLVEAIEGWDHHVFATVPVSSGEPSGLAVNPFLNELYVPLGNNMVEVFSTRTGKVLATAAAGASDVFAAVNLSTGNVLVTNSLAGPSTTEVLDRNGESLASVPVGDTPYGLDVDPFTDLAFVASTALNNVTVIDGKTNTARATVSNVSASFISVNFSTGLVYVSGSNGVTVLTEK